MSDLISRKAALAVFNDAHPLEYNVARYKDRIKHLYGFQQWIPCSERKPWDGEKVICCTEDEEILITYCFYYPNGGCGFDDVKGGIRTGDVLAWMPLPEPYTEKGTKDE